MCSVLFDACYCLLNVDCLWLAAMCSSLCAVRCVLFAVGWLFAWCLRFVVCLMLFAVGCLELVVCRALMSFRCLFDVCWLLFGCSCSLLSVALFINRCSSFGC